MGTSEGITDHLYSHFFEGNYQFLFHYFSIYGICFLFLSFLITFSYSSRA